MPEPKHLAAVLGALLLLAGWGAAWGQLDDPMRPPHRRAETPGNRAPATPQFTLSSTLIARDRRTAVLNGHRVTVGGRVAGAQVMEIEPGLVRLQRNGQRFTVPLSPYTVKTPARP